MDEIERIRQQYARGLPQVPIPDNIEWIRHQNRIMFNDIQILLNAIDLQRSAIDRLRANFVKP